MGKVISVVNQKGGVGKSTTCVNLAAALHEQGCRVLIVDTDPQGNATSGIGADKSHSPGIYDVLINDVPAEKAVFPTPYSDVIVANKTLSGAEIELVSLDNREYRLRDALLLISERYDYILIDCPPSLGLLTLNALCASSSFLVPVQCEYYALEGLSDLMYTVRAMKRSLNPTLELEGVLLTMFDSRTNLSLQVVEEVKRFFPGKVFGSVIPRNVRISEAPSHGIPVMNYDRTSRGSESYLSLAQELRRLNEAAANTERR